jgi:hypothetical protein
MLNLTLNLTLTLTLNLTLTLTLNLTLTDKVACAEAEPVPTVMEVALQEMRAFKRGWACALWVWGRLHVYLAGDLENDRRWIKKVVTGSEESEQVPVDKDRLESQHMVVMKQQKFFFVDTAGFEPFDDVRGKGEGKGKGKQQPDVQCRDSAVVFLPYSVARGPAECLRLRLILRLRLHLILC